MVVGEISRGDDLRPDAAQGGVEFLRSRDAGERDHLAADQGRCGERVGLEARADERLAGREGGDPRQRLVFAAEHDQGAHERQLRRNWRAQRAGRDAEAVAEAGLAVHDGESEVLDEARILQAVVEDDRVCAGFDRAFALLARSAPTQQGASLASSSGSSPTIAAVWALASTSRGSTRSAPP